MMYLPGHELFATCPTKFRRLLLIARILKRIGKFKGERRNELEYLKA